MSFQRYNYPLIYFDGKSKSYVFPTSFKGKDYIEDYGDIYKDNVSFIELIGKYVRMATDNQEYSEKIIKILAKKLRVEHKLRKKPLTDKEFFKLVDKQMVEFRKDKLYKKIFEKRFKK